MLTLTCPHMVQLSVVLEGRPRHRVQSHHSDGDPPDLPPNLARRKRTRDPTDNESVQSQSNDSKTLDSQDYESSEDQGDIQSLNSNELACVFDSEVCLFILMQSKIIQLFSGCSMDAK